MAGFGTRITNDNNPTNPITNLEQAISHAPNAEENMPRFHSPVRIHVHSYRHRLVDPDGISAKAAIDGLVQAEILADDTTEQITEISYSQTKIPTNQEEKTVITICESCHKKEG